ncbi:MULTISPECIES: serine/threonine-protein kinase [Amycolatopsis]|uniref:non-specific serine/threonine protein kinase n=2 Tax=Amycolatopsis TaxID=1813 RepID=A0A1I4DB21_9PSEU|nr:serine/threonine-protein kinase [Amycolatopsis sacchari]SFK90702.1 serine/threonine protein kinase [Amycolatopsis sacchari]
MTGEVSGDLTGRRLGNYRIDGVLGKGGMSVMYKATDVRLGRKVALKVIGEHLGADAEFRERFVDEARNTSAIDHANVVPLYDFGEIDGMHYIAMRLVDGADLASLLSAGPIAPERALRLLDQVADALDSLHSRGLVHLDVKPANVLVTSRESAREHVYVADFGLTRRGATGHRTRGGDFLGSPTYAAPEHLRGEPLDGRTDQYALACVLYACLTGGPPFTGDVPTVIKGHLAGEPPSVSRAVQLPAAVDDVVRRGMAKNPADRYESCRALIAAARQALGPVLGNDAQATVAARVPQADEPWASEPTVEARPQQPGGAWAGPPGAGNAWAAQPTVEARPPQPGPYSSGPHQWGDPQSSGPRQWERPAEPQSGGWHPSGYSQQPGWGQQPPQQYGQAFPPPGYGHSSGYSTPPFGAPQYGYPQRQQPAKKKSLLWLWLLLGALVVAGGVVAAVVLTGGGGSGAPETTAPDIPVGPTGGASQPPSSGGRPPATISIRPSA